MPSLDWSFLEDGVLYNRNTEYEMLHAAFERGLSRVHSKNEFILLSGKSGTGKTALAYTLQEPVSSRGGIFISGKFDQYQRPDKPYYVFATAFAQYVDVIMSDEHQTEVSQVRKAILEAFTKSDVQLLVNLIPAFEKILGKQEGISYLIRGEVRTRLEITFRKFIQTICNRNQPLLLFLDDLQWADSASLSLLKSVSVDKDCNGLVLLAACRHNEVKMDHIFAGFLRGLEDTKKAIISSIEVHNLLPRAVNEIVSDVLHMPRSKCNSLSSFIFKMTEGNVLALLHTLDSLYDKGLLYPTSDGHSWQWDTEKLIQQSAQNKKIIVVDLIVRRMKRVPIDIRNILSIAACIGAQFSKSLLSEIVLEYDVDSALDRAIEEGWVNREKGDNDNFKFVHDRVQQAAYSLIPEAKQEEFHMNIARKLWNDASDVTIGDNHLFFVVNQMSAGIKSLQDQDEKDALALLCLRAGEKAMLSSSFETAVRYYSFGIDLLPDNHWCDQYRLSIDLYSAVAEAEYCIANFKMMNIHIHEVLTNATIFKDKLRAYSTKIYSLGTRADQLDEAIEVGLSVLDHLGQFLPPNPNTLHTIVNLIKTKMVFRNKTNSEVLNWPEMKDKDIIAAMGILNILTTCSFMGRKDLFPCIALRMLQLTSKYGLSAIAAHAFGTSAIVFCAIGDYSTGSRFSDLSLRLLDRYNMRQWVPRVHVITYGMTAHWRMPYHTLTDPLLTGHHAGLETGDIEFSLINAQIRCFTMVFAGKPLHNLQDDITAALLCMKEYNQQIWYDITAPILQAVEKLSGKRETPLLTGKRMDIDKALTTTTENKKDSTFSEIQFWLLFEAYIFNDYDHAAQIAKQTADIMQVLPSSAFGLQNYFYSGLTAIAIALQSRKGRKKHIRRARKSLKMLKKFCKLCPQNCLNKISLLEAELAVVKGNINMGISLYRRSASLAVEEGLIHEQALACERASLALRMYGERKNGDHTMSVEFFGRAIKAYGEWGAHAKVEQMKK